jgi:hypothetical protein
MHLGGYLLVWPWLGALFLIGWGWLVWRAVTNSQRTRAAAIDLALSTFAAFYIFWHWLVAFPVWDRYLLPLVPVMGLLLGRMITQALGVTRNVRLQRYHGDSVTDAKRRASTFVPALSRVKAYGTGVILIILLFSIPAGSAAYVSRGRVPVGGDHGAYEGLSDIIRYLNALPVGTVLYDRWLSWHYDFYLFNAYLFRAGFPTPDWLAVDAAAFIDEGPRFLVLPGWESAARLKRALSRVQLEMTPIRASRRRDGTASFVLYEIGTQH